VRAAVLKAYPEMEVVGNAKSPRRSAFELTLNDTLLYSKFKVGRFPRPDEVVVLIKHFKETGEVPEIEADDSCTVQ
jgi:selT/selW/selH-like putative selenoprotein